MLLRTGEAAALAGMTEGGIRKAAREGRLASTVLENGTRRYSRDEVMRFGRERDGTRGSGLSGATATSTATGTATGTGIKPAKEQAGAEQTVTALALPGGAGVAGQAVTVVPEGAAAKLLDDPLVRPGWVEAMQRLASAATAEAQVRTAAAELELLRTRALADAARAEAAVRDRLRMVDDLVALVPHYAPAQDRARASAAVRLRLEALPANELNAWSWFRLGGLVQSVIDQRRHEDRLRAQEAARQRWRADRIDAVAAKLRACLGQAIPHRLEVVSHGVRAAMQTLQGLDDLTLAGALWPDHAACSAAAQAIGVVPPAPPWVADPRAGWRPAKPGD